MFLYLHSYELKSLLGWVNQILLSGTIDRSWISLRTKSITSIMIHILHGHLTGYVILRVAHAPGMLGKFSRHPFKRKPLISDPGMHHGKCLMHVSWCMSGSLSHGGKENVPGIPGACATRNSTYLVRGLCSRHKYRISYNPPGNRLWRHHQDGSKSCTVVTNCPANWC